MKRGSTTRSGIMSIIIALIIHLVILAVLFLAWRYHGARMRQHEDQADVVLSPDYGAPAAQVVMYQPPVLSSSSQSLAFTQPVQDPVSAPPVQEDNVISEESAVHDHDMQEVSQASNVPAMHKMPDISDQPVSQPTDVRKPRARKARVKKKKPSATTSLQGLSVASLARQTTSSPASNNQGYSSDPTNAQELMYRIYAGKIIQMLGNAINTDGVRLLLTSDVVRSTTLFVKIRRDGKLVAVYFEPYMPELQKIEDAIRTVAHHAGLYPKIPDGLKADPVTIRIPLKVDGKSGLGDYRFTYGRS